MAIYKLSEQVACEKKMKSAYGEEVKKKTKVEQGPELIPIPVYEKTGEKLTMYPLFVNRGQAMWQNFSV